MNRYSTGARKLIDKYSIENIPGLNLEEVGKEYNDKRATTNSLTKLQAYLKAKKKRTEVYIVLMDFFCWKIYSHMDQLPGSLFFQPVRSSCALPRNTLLVFCDFYCNSLLRESMK